MNEVTKEVLLNDFKVRCRIVKDLDVVRKNVIERKCPFLQEDFEKTSHFKAVRRFYRNNIGNGLVDDLLKIIGEVSHER